MSHRFQGDTRPIGDRIEGIRKADAPTYSSTIDPLPAYPMLKAQLRSWAATLLMTYLEIHHPDPQDYSEASAPYPFTVSIETMCDAIQVHRRTLLVSLYVLCSRFPSEEAQRRAARASREFLNPLHSMNGVVKHYSLVGPSSHRPGIVWTFRRNRAHLRSTMRKAGILRWNADLPELTPNYSSHTSAISAIPGPSFSALSEVLFRASELSLDRRSVRYPRLRKAIAEGLEGAEVLKIRRTRGSDEG